MSFPASVDRGLGVDPKSRRMHSGKLGALNTRPGRIAPASGAFVDPETHVLLVSGWLPRPSGSITGQCDTSSRGRRMHSPLSARG